MANDPDASFMDALAGGVPLGVDTELPRTPAVVEENTEWTVAEPMGDELPRWMSNYASASSHPDVLLRQFQEDASEGMMVEVTVEEARRRYPGTLTVAALEAIENPPLILMRSALSMTEPMVLSRINTSV